MTPAKLADGVTPETSVDRTIAAAKKFVDAARGKDDSDWTELRKERHGAALTIVMLAAELAEAKARNARLVALLEVESEGDRNICRDPRDGEPPTVCWFIKLLEEADACWDCQRRALLAEIKGGG